MAEEVLKIKITADNSEAVAGIGKVKNSVDGLKESIKVVQDKLFAETDVARLGKYNRELQGLQQQLKQTSNIGKEGFDQFGNAVAKTSGGLGHAFEGVRKLAYILPGIGMAGLFNLAFEGIMALVSGLDSADTRLNKFKDSYLKATSEAEGKSKAEIANVHALVAAIEDESISRQHRNEALEKLQKEYPAYFKNQGIEIGNTNALELATKKLSEALVRKSQVQALSNLIDKEYEKLATEQNSSIKQKVDALSGAAKAWDFVKGSISQFTAAGMAASISTNLLRDGIETSSEKAKESQKNIENLTKSLKELTKEQVNSGDFYKEEKEKGVGPIHALISKQAKVTDGRDKVSGVSVFTQEYKDLKLYTDEVQRMLNLEKQKAIQDSLRVNKYLDSNIKTKDLAEYDKQQAQKEYDRINNQKYLVQLQQDFNFKLAEQQRLADGIGNSFANLFHNIARSKNPFEALQNAVKQLVIDLAAAVAKMLIIKAIMTLINPAGAAAKGIGAVMGAALGGIPQHAAGGVTTGPSLGIVGEAGPEAIIPLDRLNGFIDRAAKMGAMAMGGSSNSQSGGEFTLRGQDLVLAMQRSNYSLNIRR